MKNLITCLVVCVLSGAALAETWTVDDNGKADFDNIQAAVDAASNGDEIIVMPGTYTGTDDQVVDMLGKAVWLHSSGGQEETIIDGEGVRRVFFCYSGETSNTIIEGFTITNGFGWNGAGMNIYESNPTLKSCTFTDNFADEYGGGIYNGGSLTLTYCTFKRNTADKGGGIYNGGSLTLTYCTFETNIVSQDGGGMFNDYYSSSTLAGCTFTGNTASQNGGGMCNDTNSSTTLIGCEITSNSASTGGGIWNWGSNLTLTKNSICGNFPAVQIFGDWIDGGDNTVAETCPWNQGACCTNDNCLVSDQEDCDAFFGQWLGEGTTCEDNPCPTNCLGDLTGDGQVNVNDLLILIAVWGVCP